MATQTAASPLSAADAAALAACIADVSDIPAEDQQRARDRFRAAAEEARSGVGHGDWTTWLATR